jgi:hypothetical protein
MFRHVITGWAWKKEDDVINSLWRWFAAYYFQDYRLLVSAQAQETTTTSAFYTTAISIKLRVMIRAYQYDELLRVLQNQKKLD